MTLIKIYPFIPCRQSPLRLYYIIKEAGEAKPAYTVHFKVNHIKPPDDIYKHAYTYDYVFHKIERKPK